MSEHIPTVLVVDDKPDWRETIRGLLVDEGYQVEVAGSTSEAKQKLRESSVDLAIIDMRLDETDTSNIEGLEVLAKIIRNEYSHTKTIIFTGFATQQTLRKAMRPDAKGQTLASFFMEKNETEKLISKVKKLLPY